MIRDKLAFAAAGARFSVFTAVAGGAFWAAAAAAQEQPVSLPKPGQMGLPEPVTDVARDINFFHDIILMPIITVITLFVLGLLIYVCVRFHEKNNPTPSRTTHHTGLEVAWTVLPVLILLFISAFSFPLLTKQLVIPKADHVIKVSGTPGWTWQWTYPKEEAGGFDFISKLLDQDKLPPGKMKLLDVDNEAVVPVNKVIRLQVTADPAGIIHSFVIPAFGVRIDAVPGRLNETWFKAEKEGIYYGQCSKICGKDHAYMPMVVRVVSEARYKAWLEEAKKKFAASEPAVRFAGAGAAQQ